jgi:hypothetical protein
VRLKIHTTWIGPDWGFDHRSKSRQLQQSQEWRVFIFFFKTRAEARIVVFKFIEGFYNPRRRHSSIGYLSPVDYERRHVVNPDARQPAVVLAAVKGQALLAATRAIQGVEAGGLVAGRLDRPVNLVDREPREVSRLAGAHSGHGGRRRSCHFRWSAIS